VKYGVDEDTCTGDHSCIRLSGCPTLTVKDNPDPLRRDPVATVIDGCVGCGLCGEKRACRGALPVVLPRRGDPEPGAFDRFKAKLRGCSHDPSRTSDHDPHRRAGRRRRRRDGRLADGGRHQVRPAGPGDVDPGVAQRTGATTYYLEIFPARKTELGAGNPCFADAEPGNVDIMVASELVEAGRAMANGYVSPERTTLIASTHRIYATVEKMQMADGRYDGERVVEAARQLAQRSLLFDMRSSRRKTAP
jgi:NAD-dependent dihydropyrimidine dehydrogenase PreA subunit